MRKVGAKGKRFYAAANWYNQLSEGVGRSFSNFDACIWPPFQQTLVHQLLQCFANGSTADAKPFDQF